MYENGKKRGENGSVSNEAASQLFTMQWMHACPAYQLLPACLLNEEQSQAVVVVVVVSDERFDPLSLSKLAILFLSAFW